MKLSLKIAICILFIHNTVNTINAQNGGLPNYFSYNVSLSNYNFNNKFVNRTVASSNSNSFGFGATYWKPISNHLYFSGSLTGTFSNFPRLFIKGDSIGLAKFSLQADALMHLNLLANTAKVNPFLTAGLGAGIFGGKLAPYAPVGIGFNLQTKGGTLFILQAQYRKILSADITNDYLFYSFGIAKRGLLDGVEKEKKQKAPKVKKEKTEKEKIKKETAPRKKPIAVIDTDGDGVPDNEDRCPTIKGTIKGCPDTDSDGIADLDDSCKTVKGVARYHGCPIPDTDGDGVNDESDKCPSVKGAKENFGCPWPDTDGDGIPDKDDKCPGIFGKAEYNGCPLPVFDGVVPNRMVADSVYYIIYFNQDKDVIGTDAFVALNAIVQILNSNNDLRLTITGHTDNNGTDFSNYKLGMNRAEITKKYLLSYSLDPKKITSVKSFGSKKPMDPNQQWRNRRVEICVYKK